ncbi:MAG: hypothetical protein JWN57_2448 [Frankiales bacterium]|nr:hypothetical protein [Frankiales bacterium]
MPGSPTWSVPGLVEGELSRQRLLREVLLTVEPLLLVLDRYVARALTNHHGMPLRGTGWSSADSSRYLNLAADLARQAGTSPDALEMALYTS